MIVDMNSLIENAQGVLAGALNGRRACFELIERTSSDPQDPSPLYLDFQNVEVATASYLRECVLEFRNATRRRRSNWYPVVANCSANVVEEFNVLLGNGGNAILTCNLTDKGRPADAVLLGNLDSKQKLAYDLVNRLGPVDAAQLVKLDEVNEEKVVQTAWNNRLSSLVNLGLVIEQKQGRSKKYRPLLVGV